MAEGVPPEDWEAVYGVSVSGNALTGKFIADSGNVGWRLYLVADTETEYQMFRLKNQVRFFPYYVQTHPPSNAAPLVVVPCISTYLLHFP